MGQCDNCGNYGKTRRIELGENTGMTLCNSCLKKEIHWRKQKNERLIKSYGSERLAKDTLFRTKYKF